jgi:cell division septal protein FtsQ
VNCQKQPNKEMENQNKQSNLDKFMDFIINFFIECIPTRNELKTQKIKALLKVLLLTIGVLIGLSLLGVLLAIYLLGIFLMVFGKILSIGATADRKHEKSQDRHFEENGRYF